MKKTVVRSSDALHSSIVLLWGPVVGPDLHVAQSVSQYMFSHRFSSTRHWALRGGHQIRTVGKNREISAPSLMIQQP